jgi:hypothetical protein
MAKLTLSNHFRILSEIAEDDPGISGAGLN